MQGLVFHWDENQRLKADARVQKRLIKQWTHTAKAFGIKNLLIIGKHPIINDSEILIETFESYSDIRIKYNNYKYVIITQEGEDYQNIVFPKGDVLFVVGSNYSNPIINKGDIAVSIKSNIPLWDIVAAGIILNRAH